MQVMELKASAQEQAASQMDLSIVIVNWNTRELTVACLESVYANAGDLRFQVILIDNASSDDSVEVIRDQFPQVELIVNDTNRGFAAANNQGFARCAGRYVLLLNSDTIVLGDALPASVRYMDEHDDIAVFGLRVLNEDRSVQLACGMDPSPLNLFLQTSGLHRLNKPHWLGRYRMKHWDRGDARDVQTVGGCYMVVRKSAMDEVGVLDEAFYFYGEETDWCIRFRQAGWRVHVAPVGEIIHYGGASVKKLNFKRELMISQAFVRLNLKHGGLVPALLVWLIVWGFNVSRCVFWAIAGVFMGSSARERAKHFWNVTIRPSGLWPSKAS